VRHQDDCVGAVYEHYRPFKVVPVCEAWPAFSTCASASAGLVTALVMA
jgi:hypothetical protein